MEDPQDLVSGQSYANGDIPNPSKRRKTTNIYVRGSIDSIHMTAHD